MAIRGCSEPSDNYRFTEKGGNLHRTHLLEIWSSLSHHAGAMIFHEVVGFETKL